MSEYLGWKAGVIPTNDDNLRFINSQLISIDERRRAKEAAAAQAEQERQNDLVKFLGDNTADKLFTTDPKMNPFITELLTNTKLSLIQDIRKTKQDLPTFAQKVYGSLGQISDLAKTYKAQGEGIRNYVAKQAPLDPSLDWAALTDAGLMQTFYKKDEKGNWVQKAPGELGNADPVETINGLIRENPNMFLNNAKPLATFNAAITDKQKKQESAETKYGNDPKTGKPFMQTRGFKAEYSDLFSPIKDQNGTVTGIDVITEPFKVDGQAIVGKDNKPVMVVPEGTYQQYMGMPSGISAAVEVAMRKKFPEYDPKQNPKADVNSAGAELARRMTFTDMVRQYGGFKWNPDNDDKLNQLTEQWRDNQRADQSLQLSKNADARASRKEAREVAQENAQFRDVFGQTVEEIRAAGAEVGSAYQPKTMLGRMVSPIFNAEVNFKATPITEFNQTFIEKAIGSVKLTYSENDAKYISGENIKAVYDKKNNRIALLAPKQPSDPESKYVVKANISANDLNVGKGVNPNKSERAGAIGEYGNQSQNAPKPKGGKGQLSKKSGGIVIPPPNQNLFQ